MSVHKHDDLPAGGHCARACCLRAEGLGVTAGDQVILHDVDFHLHCGEITALIGPNGAGKSTLFKTVLGQLPHTGTIDFQKAGGKHTRPLIGYVPQSPSFDRGDPVSVLDLFSASISDWPVFLPTPRRLRARVAECLSRVHAEGLIDKRIGALSVLDLFSASISDWPVFLPTPRRLRARVAECLSRVHAEGLIDKRIGALSGGELQRVLLAMALEPVPHILILDEPLSGVDIEGEKQLLDMLDEVRTQYDLSILLSTHDFATLEEYADKVILLQGTVLEAGKPAQVLSSQAFRDVFHLTLGREGR